MKIYKISELNAEVRRLLEGHFTSIWIEGEISNLAMPHSGHWYFSLKDPSAQVRCAMFRNRNRQLAFTPTDGMHILARATVSLYPDRGDYQLIVEDLEPAGDGLLKQAFEKLKVELSRAGLFAAEHKKSLPEFPHCVGVITSPTGAAIRDILSVIKRRCPAIPVIIYPCAVQGKSAAAEIASAINIANQRQECDVLILARGGGSLEDLWPFNEIVVAQAIYDSNIPIVSGVGHEIDITIADYVADLRAPTPSGAAEIICPAREELAARLRHTQQRLSLLLRQQVQFAAHTLQQVMRRFRQLGQFLRPQSQTIDFLERHLLASFMHRLQKWQHTVTQLSSNLHRHAPQARLQQQHLHLQQQAKSLKDCMQKLLWQHNTELKNLATTLHAVSPLATLSRGYAIVSSMEGTVIQSLEQVQQDMEIEVRVKDGKFSAYTREG